MSNFVSGFEPSFSPEDPNPTPDLAQAPTPDLTPGPSQNATAANVTATSGVPSSVFKRKIGAQIKQWMTTDADHPLLIKGVRRCGKTTVIESLGRQAFGDGFIKLDFQTELSTIETFFDGPTDDVDRIVAAIADYFRADIKKESALLFFDEVQLCEKALNSLRFFAGSGWRVIASGSLLDTSAAARKLPFPSGVRQLEMHPMDFEEWLWAMGEENLAQAIRSHFQTLEPYVLHEEALKLYHRYLVVGGMPRVVRAYLESGDFAQVRIEQAEIDATYTADMTNPELNISGVSAKRIWDSLPKQLLRASTKKFKYSDVIRGGRRSRLMEPLEWLDAAGVLTMCDMTKDTAVPLAAYDEDDGSYFKVYVADTGILFYKFGIDARLFLEVTDSGQTIGSSDFRGALAENYVAQMLSAQNVKTYYWTPPSSWGGNGELDFVLQTRAAEVIPVEVKSARNVGAKTLKTFMEKTEAPILYRLSERQFGKEPTSTGAELRSVPLYAAFCLGENCIGE